VHPTDPDPLASPLNLQQFPVKIAGDTPTRTK